ncbi:MAG: Gfo/Idh/MocA family oxidoreductase [Anaerolineaceae bacterium]|nr:MAG: Gfo/Idh/MocA family oxidoreductase [Anaerolineaceae bacterium]
MNNTLRIGILGSGSVANKAYLPLLRTWPNTRIVGLFGRTKENVEKICSDWQLEFGTTDLDALIDQKPDVAFVLTSRPSHEPLVKELLQSGIDVYVEKPATESSKSISALSNLADQRKLVLMVGFNRRYALLYRQAKEIFNHRPIQMCIVEKHRPSAYHTSLYNNYLEDTIHQIDLLRFFCGDVQALHTSFEMRDGKLIGASSVAKPEEGGLAVVLTSLQAGSWQERVTLHGGALTAEVTAFRELIVKHEDRVEVYGPDRPGRWIPELVERGFHGAIEHFFHCVRERETPQTDGHEGFRTQELVEAFVTCAGEKLVVTPQF